MGYTKEELMFIGFSEPEAEWFADYSANAKKPLPDISKEDIPYFSKTMVFQLNKMKGNIAKAILRAILSEFGYITFPYGYESHFEPIIESLQQNNQDRAVRQIRTMPDLFVYDSETNKGYTVEIKSTNTRDESRFWMKKEVLKRYIEYWNEALLIVFCFRTSNIYAKKFGDINKDSLETDYIFDKDVYALNLVGDFKPLNYYFPKIHPKKFPKFYGRIRAALKSFNPDYSIQS
jgi:hypothetical protein